MSENTAEKTFILDKPPGGSDGISIAPQGNSGSIKLKDTLYTIVEMLGVTSGEADIYLVCGPGDGRKFILKYYRRNIEPKHEIVEMLAGLGSSRVVSIIDYGSTAEGRFYELQEYAEHGALDAFIKNNPGAVDGRFIRSFVLELNECLSDIHSKNIIHRDIKPSNILIRSVEPLAIALTDFGISSVSASLVHQTNYNRTITYAAPEALSGMVSKASDYWSLGIIVLEMLLKKHPYEDMDAKTITYCITTKEVPGVESVTGEFYPLVKGTLNRDDKRRWRHREVGDWLADIIKNDFYEPFSFYGAKCLDLKELSMNLVANWDRASREIVLIKQWLLKNVTERGLVPLIKELCRHGVSEDASLFEMLCIINPEMKMIFRKINITRELLAEISFKIYDGDGTPEEMGLLDALVDGRLFRKYCEMASGGADFKRDLLAAEEESFAVKETAKRAEIFLGRLAPEKLGQKTGPYKALLRKIRKIEYSKNHLYLIGLGLIGLIFLLAFILISIYD
jgi:serine/threonine protein kinase